MDDKTERMLEDIAWWIKEQLDGTPIIFSDEQTQDMLNKLVKEYRGE